LLDGKLLGKVVRAFLGAVLAFYKKRCGVSGAVAVVQRTSSDLKLNPHVHAVFLDGGYAGESFVALGHLRGSEVAEVLAKAKRRIERVLARPQTRSEDDAELPPLKYLVSRTGNVQCADGGLVAPLQPHSAQFPCASECCS
jgi:Putative transposase